MDLYTRIDLLVLALPLALSFDRKVAFWRSWPQVFPAIAVVMAVFIPWDAWKTAQGVWGFNPEYAGNLRFLHLPPGEWLFFVCVPYACSSFWRACGPISATGILVFPGWGVFLVAGLFVGLACRFRELTYTGTVFLSVAVVLVLFEYLVPATLRSRNFWIALGLTYLPFLVANGVLTGLPIVWYDDTQILAIRAGTIPLEDFFYSFSMLALAALVHDRVGKWRRAA
jgi:lycopene cyclase domain-containing protein